MNESMSLKRRMRNFINRDAFQAFIFLLPAVIILIAFSYYPIFSIFNLSFFRWENLSPEKHFIGFLNYINLFQNPRFWNSLRVTAEYTFSVTFVSIFLGLVIAVLLNRKMLLMKSVWRSVLFLPIVTPSVAAAMVWRLLFNPNVGYINRLLETFSIPGPNWLADKQWALFTIILLGIWKRLGFNMILFLAALQSIPSMYYESAKVDGANAFKLFSKITIPLLQPTTVMLVILGIIDSFLVFDQVMILTRGGPLNQTEVIGWYMYNNAFSFLKMGYGATISVVIFIVIAILTILQWRFVGFGSLDQS